MRRAGRRSRSSTISPVPASCRSSSVMVPAWLAGGRRRTAGWWRYGSTRTGRPTSGSKRLSVQTRFPSSSAAPGSAARAHDCHRGGLHVLDCRPRPPTRRIKPPNHQRTEWSATGMQISLRWAAACCRTCQKGSSTPDSTALSRVWPRRVTTSLTTCSASSGACPIPGSGNCSSRPGSKQPTRHRVPDPSSRRSEMQPVKHATAEFLAGKRVAVTGVSRKPQGHGSNVHLPAPVVRPQPARHPRPADRPGLIPACQKPPRLALIQPRSAASEAGDRSAPAQRVAPGHRSPRHPLCRRFSLAPRLASGKGGVLSQPALPRPGSPDAPDRPGISPAAPSAGPVSQSGHCACIPVKRHLPGWVCPLIWWRVGARGAGRTSAA
jgi:hypothetical protein